MVERVGLQLLQGLLHIHKHNHLDRVAVLICAGEFYGLEIFMHGCVQGDFGIALLRFNGAFCFRENVEFHCVAYPLASYEAGQQRPAPHYKHKLCRLGKPVNITIPALQASGVPDFQFITGPLDPIQIGINRLLLNVQVTGKGGDRHETIAQI